MVVVKMQGFRLGAKIEGTYSPVFEGFCVILLRNVEDVIGTKEAHIVLLAIVPSSAAGLAARYHKFRVHGSAYNSAPLTSLRAVVGSLFLAHGSLALFTFRRLGCLPIYCSLLLLIASS